jgi:hypothetical protein
VLLHEWDEVADALDQVKKLLLTAFQVVDKAKQKPECGRPSSTMGKRNRLELIARIL